MTKRISDETLDVCGKRLAIELQDLSRFVGMLAKERGEMLDLLGEALAVLHWAMVDSPQEAAPAAHETVAKIRDMIARREI